MDELHDNNKILEENPRTARLTDEPTSKEEGEKVSKDSKCDGEPLSCSVDKPCDDGNDVSCVPRHCVVPVGPLPHLSSVYYEIDGVPAIPRPAMPPVLSPSRVGVGVGVGESISKFSSETRRTTHYDVPEYGLESTATTMVEEAKRLQSRSWGWEVGTTDDENMEPLSQNDLDLRNKRLALWRDRRGGYLPGHRFEEGDCSHNGRRRATTGCLDRNPAFPSIPYDGEASGLENGVEGHWIEYWDKEVGASYYFNHITGEASWVNPEEES